MSAMRRRADSIQHGCSGPFLANRRHLHHPATGTDVTKEPRVPGLWNVAHKVFGNLAYRLWILTVRRQSAFGGDRAVNMSLRLRPDRTVGWVHDKECPVGDGR